MKNLLCLSTLLVSSLMLLAAFAPALALSNPLTASNMGVLSTALGTATSTNWCGYAVTTSSVTSASGSWTVPMVTPQTTSGTDYAAFWVGIDGYSDSTVEQTGILAETTSAGTTWLAWFEFYPGPMYEIVETVNGKQVPVPISPGDTITASVTYSGSSSGSVFGNLLNGPSGATDLLVGPSSVVGAPGSSFSFPGRTSSSFTITITDSTSQWTYSTKSSVSGAQRTSAEWIVETPTVSNGRSSSLASLAQFSTTSFSGCTASTATIANQAIGSYTNNYAITMVAQANHATTMASPTSPLGSGGSSFQVNWANYGP